ncbi:SRPBCC domain-containing protein [Micromonospora sp. NPDC048871]|uniref:SRPBCC domain-containing protein n=1 Tax=unclassified Micromonospora TaxID=2617518 RepID=UPI002E10E72E|nr:SRPBCC domain-containing protein [Micromonospora sp. NBC_01739]
MKKGTCWGRVLIWDPPGRLVFTWQIGPDRAPVPDPALASEVEVQFTPAAAGTLVEVTHRHFDRHGEAAEGYRQALTAGWSELLSRFAATVVDRPG